MVFLSLSLSLWRAGRLQRLERVWTGVLIEIHIEIHIERIKQKNETEDMPNSRTEEAHES